MKFKLGSAGLFLLLLERIGYVRCPGIYLHHT